MKPQLKQRIMGGLILLSIMAVFLPVLFHNTHPRVSAEDSANESTVNTEVSLSHQDANDQSELLPTTPVAQAPVTPSSQLTRTPRINNNKHVVDQNLAYRYSPEQSQNTEVSSESVNNLEEQTLHENKNPVKNTAPKVQTLRREGQLISQTKELQKPAQHSVASVTPVLLHPIHNTEREEKTQNAVELKPISSSKPLLLSDKLSTQAWVLQVGIFSTHQRAELLANRLRQKGFDVYVASQMDGKGRRLEKVFVGPVIHLATVKNLQQQLKKEFKLKAMIKEYTS